MQEPRWVYVGDDLNPRMVVELGLAGNPGETLAAYIKRKGWAGGAYRMSDFVLGVY